MITSPHLQRQLESLDRQYFFRDRLSVCPYHRCEWLSDRTSIEICLGHFEGDFVPAHIVNQIRIQFAIFTAYRQTHTHTIHTFIIDKINIGNWNRREKKNSHKLSTPAYSLGRHYCWANNAVRHRYQFPISGQT